jgi:hypothetical protein
MAREHCASAVLNAWHSCHAAVLQSQFGRHQLGSSVAAQAVMMAGVDVAAVDSFAVTGLFCEIPP